MRKYQNNYIYVEDGITNDFTVFSKTPKYLKIYSKKKGFPFFFKIDKIKGSYMVDIKIYISKNNKTPCEENYDYLFY